MEAEVFHQDEQSPTKDANKLCELLKESEEPLW